MVRTCFQLLVILGLLTLALQASEPVTIDATPKHGFIPLFVHLRVLVEPNEHNRAFCLLWFPEGAHEFPNRSCFPLEGAKAPRLYLFDRMVREEGRWIFVAQVLRAVGSSPIALASVMAIGDSP